jgi:hypothetical protein
MPLQSPVSIGFAGTLNLGQRGKSVVPLLAKELIEAGYTVTESDDADFLINLNHNWQSLKGHKRVNHPANHGCVLIRLEPSSVYPAQYTEKIESEYRLVISPGRTDLPKEQFVRWPYEYQANPSTPELITPSIKDVVSAKIALGLYDYDHWVKRPINCSMVVANKVSPNNSGNYALRREFAKSTPEGTLNVYGALWRASFPQKFRHRLGLLSFALRSGSQVRLRSIFAGMFESYPNIVGPILNKHDIIEQSKFSLVIENSDEYISEKLIDALIGGSIPIYIGASLHNSGIPEDLVLGFESNPYELGGFLENLDEKIITDKLELIKRFLNGKELLAWEASSVLKEIAIQIDSLVKDGE